MLPIGWLLFVRFDKNLSSGRLHARARARENKVYVAKLFIHIPRLQKKKKLIKQTRV